MSVINFLSLASASVSLKTESAPLHHIHCLHSVRCRLVATASKTKTRNKVNTKHLECFMRISMEYLRDDLDKY